MSATDIGNLAMKLSAKDNGYSTTMDKARDKVTGLNKAIEEGKAANAKFFDSEVERKMAQRIKSMEDAAMKHNVNEAVNMKLFGNPEGSGKEAGKGFMAELNAQLGKKSMLGKSLKLLAGGGVIGGLGLAAKEFDELTKKAEDFVKQYARGEIHTKEFTAHLLESIPIVGSLGAGLSRVWGILSGATAEEAKFNQQLEWQNAVTDVMALRLRVAKDAAKETADYVQKVSDKLKLMWLTGKDREAAEQFIQFRDNIKQISEEAAKAKKAIEDAKETKKIKEMEEQAKQMPAMIEVGGKYVSAGVGGAGYYVPGQVVQNPQLAKLQAAIAQAKKQLDEANAAVDAEQRTKADAETKLYFGQKIKGWQDGAMDFLDKVKETNAKLDKEWREDIKKNKDRATEIADIHRKTLALVGGMTEGTYSKLEELRKKGAGENELTQAKQFLDEQEKAEKAMETVKRYNEKLKEHNEHAIKERKNPLIDPRTGEGQKLRYELKMGQDSEDRDIQKQQLDEFRKATAYLATLASSSSPAAASPGSSVDIFNSN